MKSERTLILAPRGRDADIAESLLSRHGLQSDICGDLPQLLAGLVEGAAAALITEEALAAIDNADLAQWVADQPTWSDLPFIILANGIRTPRATVATNRLNALGNVVLLERPLHAEAMLGAVRSALKARSRQYEIRDAAETLERAVVDRTRDLENARESLEIALDAADMGSWDLDLETGETRRTQRHDEIFGYSTPLSRWDIATFISHVDPDHRNAAAEIFDRACETGTLELECSITGADGRRRCIVARGRVRFDPNGKPVRMSGVVSDVTDRKEADARLLQAQKMDAIGQLTGGVAHDFNNLLTPIVGSLDMLRRRHVDDDRTQRMIAGALQAAERAATLTQRLLSFARRQSLQPKAVDLGALIEGIVDLVRRSLGPSITVALEIPENLPSAFVDPNQLELALLNLAINARDAMPRGGRLRLTVSTAELDARNLLGLEPGPYVCLVAADTGVGMDEATLARAAEPFFSTKDVGKGTGLGLSMAHGLAAQSGGALKLRSSPGVGTDVELWLPATISSSADAAEPGTEPVFALHAETVVLVDDEELVRAATAEMLRDVGYKVIEFESGSQALSALRSGIEADVVVSDYLMPGMTGGQLLSELRANGSRIPALLVTGYVAAGDDVPADVPRLAKPFRQADLATMVEELLKSGKVGSRGLKAVV